MGGRGVWRGVGLGGLLMCREGVWPEGIREGYIRKEGGIQNTEWEEQNTAGRMISTQSLSLSLHSLYM